MGMESFPPEILEKIVQDCCLCFKDLSHFSSTCKRFREIGNSNETWMLKFQLAFPSLFLHFPLNSSNQISWKDEVKKRIQIGCDVRTEVNRMSEKFFNKTELSSSDFHWFDDLLVQYNTNKSFIHLYVTDTLRSILDLKTQTNLTNKYYALKCIGHVKHTILKHKFLSYLEDDEALSYEAALVMVAQWSQPALDISTRSVAKQLDKVATSILAQLLDSNPQHTIFTKIRADQEEHCQVNLTKLPSLPGKLNENCWNPQECRQILGSANHVMYAQEGFSGNSQDYYNPDNSYINRVLETKKGIPITMCLLYTCVMARLGVKCLPVNFPGHFLLKWLEHPEESEEAYKFTFIDAFDGGRQLSGAQTREMVPHLVTQEDSYQVAEPLSVAQRMLRNLISIGASRSNNMRDPSYTLLRSSLELMLIINMSDTMQYGFMLSRVYLQLSINHEDVMNMLQEFRDLPGISDQVDYLMNNCQIQMEERDKEERKDPKKRGVAASFPHGPVKMWIGQVCRHKKYSYVCVVHGWDMVCTASRSWISQMGVDKLENKDKQPFYNVLVADGSNRYAAQENLLPIKPQLVSHSEVGRYFDQFEDNVGYLPNSELALLYPDERQIHWQAEL